MIRSARSLVLAVAALGLLIPASPATADDLVTPATSGETMAQVLSDLPVDAVDVTDTDTSLRSTTNEVTVLVAGDGGTPEVAKLRADSAADAEALVEQLDAEPGVAAAPTARLRALEATANPEPMAAQQWNLEMVGAPAAWATSRGAGVSVAVVDTGVDATHPDLVGRVLPEIDLLPDVTPDPEDNSHGTRIASLIAGAVNGVGMAGIAPQANILPVAALDPTGIGDSSTVAKAIIAAADAGARVINLSLGGPDRDPVLDLACAYAWSKGAILVAAGGNSYQLGNRLQYPAASPDVVAVASVDDTGTPSSFSNTGPHIALAAPGEDVLAAVPGGGYDLESGTSFATPHVAAVMALVAAANPRLSASQIVQVTELTAADDASGNGKDAQLGYGIVRADRAVATAVQLTGSVVSTGATGKQRLRNLNAGPEPLRRGSVATVKVRVQTRAADGAWRRDPMPTLVRFEFKSSGHKYRVVGEVPTDATGLATLYATPTSSGSWRAKVRLATGKWAYSGTDHVRVRR